MLRRWLIFVLVFISFALKAGAGSEKIKCISFPPSASLQRADVYFLKMTKNPVGLIVLCPGQNGDGRELLCEKLWQNFAAANNYDLVAISFASNEAELKQNSGYYDATLESGHILLDSIDKMYPNSLPLMIYGFSGGAHFSESLVNWKPSRFSVWCAYSAAFWSGPLKKPNYPPGIIACGEDDAPRFGASLHYFMKCRKLGLRVTWVGIPATAHERNEGFEGFVRIYFKSIMSEKFKYDQSGIYFNFNTQTMASVPSCEGGDVSVCWFPNLEVVNEWRNLVTSLNCNQVN